MCRILVWNPWGPMGWLWLEKATTLPGDGLLDGPDCRGKGVLALLGRDRLVVSLSSMMMYTHGLAMLLENRKKYGSQ